MRLKLVIASLIASVWTSCSTDQTMGTLKLNESIRLNQIGYFPDQSKVAIILCEESPGEFFVWDAQQKKVVHEGVAVKLDAKTFSGKTAWRVDFSALSEEGVYEIGVNDLGKSYPFTIRKDVFSDLSKASLKAFYFQRASTDLPEEFAGKWSRAGGHPDTLVQIHPSAASSSRPVGTTVSSPRGWYDAGDYNKYIVNSGITMGTLMSLYEGFPEFFARQDLAIPESGNALPDILDEVLWNLEWMLTMQDPTDGGVYHKLTTAKFEGMVEPHEATNTRYLVRKSTAATLDFAAVMAQAARIYKAFSPEDAVIYQKAAETAWNWALLHPEEYYKQDELNVNYDPDVSTGAYGDRDLTDEWVWAASELYISTHNLGYWDVLESADLEYRLPSWSQVKWLGLYSLIRHETALPQISEEWMATLKINLIAAAKSYQIAGQTQPFLSPMGASSKDFIWGSNAVASNQGILLIEAYKLNAEMGFLQGAKANLDYILGRNATGFCYVTGFGFKSPKYPHHRLAASRPELPPLPGFIVGGPNPSQQDGCEYPSGFPDESFTDLECSYASNEIAINWSAAFAYLVNAIQAIEGSGE
jgi:endoglucanase